LITIVYMYEHHFFNS